MADIWLRMEISTGQTLSIVTGPMDMKKLKRLIQYLGMVRDIEFDETQEDTNPKDTPHD